MKSASFIKKYGILSILLLLLVVFSVLSPAFLSASNLLNILRQISMAGIVAVGSTFVMLSGGIDLSVGSCMTLVGTFAAILIAKLGVNPVLAVIISVMLGAVLGLLNGYLVNTFRIHSLMVTLATMTIFNGISNVISGGVAVYGFPESFTLLGQGYLWIIPVPVIVLAIVTILATIILEKTYLGRYTYSVGGNEEATRLSGINIKRMKLFIFSSCGFFTGIAGIVLLSRMNSALSGAGDPFTFDALTGAIIGGVSIKGGEGKVYGAIIGSIIIGVLSNGLILLNIDTHIQSIIKGLVLLFALGMDGFQYGRKRLGKAST